MSQKMLTNQTRIADLTIQELRELIRGVVREELQQQPVVIPKPQAALLELTPLQVGGWPNGLELLSRAEYYDDER
jgi:hypothetical protein